MEQSDTFASIGLFSHISSIITVQNDISRKAVVLD